MANVQDFDIRIMMILLNFYFSEPSFYQNASGGRDPEILDIDIGIERNLIVT